MLMKNVVFHMHEKFLWSSTSNNREICSWNFHVNKIFSKGMNTYEFGPRVMHKALKFILMFNWIIYIFENNQFIFIPYRCLFKYKKSIKHNQMALVYTVVFIYILYIILKLSLKGLRFNTSDKWLLYLLLNR